MRAVCLSKCGLNAAALTSKPRQRCLQASREPQAQTAYGIRLDKERHRRQQQQQEEFLQPLPLGYLLPRQAVALFAAGATLGPFCDGLHSQHNVLHYVSPTLSLQLESLGWSFETCWWVPLLFGVAGLIVGVSVPLLDELAASQSQFSPPPAGQEAAGGSSAQVSAVRMGMHEASWPWVLLCISLFVAQYGLSGVLEQPLLGQTLLGSSPVPTLDAVLLAYALVHWGVFDRSLQGFGMSVLTAVCGPAIEVALINVLGLYYYTHPVWFDAVPSWIPWVYFCGGPAVGNLGRLVWQTLKSQHACKTSQR